MEITANTEPRNKLDDGSLPFFFDWPKFAISRLSSTANTESLELSQRVEARMLTHSVTFYTHSSS